jgi:hypothetical protein
MQVTPGLLLLPPELIQAVIQEVRCFQVIAINWLYSHSSVEEKNAVIFAQHAGF